MFVFLTRTATDSSYHKRHTPENGQYTRQYYFGNAPVGTSVMAAVQEQDTALTDTGEKNIEAARNYSEKHTAVPYYDRRCWHSASWF